MKGIERESSWLFEGEVFLKSKTFDVFVVSRSEVQSFAVTHSLANSVGLWKIGRYDLGLSRGLSLGLDSARAGGSK